MFSDSLDYFHSEEELLSVETFSESDNPNSFRIKSFF